MYIRSLPHSRRSRNRRRSGRWVRCAILDRKWVAPNAKIGLYLLDDKRRETERAVDYDGDPIALGASSTERDLLDAIHRYGDGRYRLVARDRRGHILARRDFVASVFAHRLDQAVHKPRTDVERLKAELAAAREAGESARAERDAARAEAETLRQAIVERDAEMAGLEAALDQKCQALRRARRLYAELGSEATAVHHEDDNQATEDDAEEPGASRHRRPAAPRGRSTPSGPPDDSGPTLFGLGRAELKEIAGFFKELISDKPSTNAGPSVDPPAEDAEPAGDPPAEGAEPADDGGGHELRPSSFYPPDVDFSGLRFDTQSQAQGHSQRGGADVITTNPEAAER